MAVSRINLSSEFFDRTSAKMLVQPEPQYLYAQLVFMAEAQAQLRRAERLGVSTERAVGGMGADVPGFESVRLVLADNVRSEAIMTTDELAPGKVGHTIRFNRPIFTDSTYTEAARTVAASSSISTEAINLTAEQTSITIKRFAGPYGASAVQPYAVDRFDAEHSVHSLANAVGMHLARDRWKFMDTVMGGLFDTVASGYTIFPGNSNNDITADSSAFVASVTGSQRPFDVETIFRAEEKLQGANIPRFANGSYIAILSPKQVRQLRSDPAFKQLAVFDSSRNPLARSFVASIGNVEIYVSATNATDSSTVSGVTIQHGVMFGPSKVGYANAGPCRVAAANEDNYGETAKVIWLAYEGFGNLDARFAVAMHSD